MSEHIYQHIPSFIQPDSIERMTEEQYLTFLEALQERRLQYKEVVKQKTAARMRSPQDVRKKLERQYEMLNTELERMDKLIEKVDKRVKGIFALRIESEGINAMSDFPTLDQMEKLNGEQ